MSLTQARAFGAIIVLSTVMSIAVSSDSEDFDPDSLCPKGFANFGDSLTDTGNSLDAFPFLTDAENPPYGESFFGAPAKRFSNGRLVPDFFSLAFKKPLLDAYFSVASFNYKYGINFANAGATAAFSLTALTPISVTPVQINQFIRFKNSVMASQNQLGCYNFNPNLPNTRSQNPFPTWLYTIVAGGNDYLGPFQRGVPNSYINSTIVPQAVKSIVAAVVTLYNNGARQFLVFGVPAGGCSTIVLTLLGNSGLPKDSLGCIIDVNSIASNFNSQLLQQIQFLRGNLTGARIAYFDYYRANIEILTHPANYGFTPSLNQTACCGAPGVGSLNYNPAVPCGRPGSNKCANPDNYLIWDGVHFTEAFYRVISQFALAGQFTDGGINYDKFCDLEYSKFGSGVTFARAYPAQSCNNLYA